MKPAVSTHLFVFNRLEERFLAWVAEAGFGAVELWAAEHHFDYGDDATVTRVRDWLRGTGLSVASIHLPFYHAFGTPQFRYIGFADPRPDHRALMGEQARRLLEVAERLDCWRLILHPASTRRRQGNLRRLRAALDWFAPLCRARGISLALENIMLPETRTGRLAALCAEYDHGLGICLDTGHAHVDGGLIYELCGAGSRLTAMHVHDNHGAGDEHLVPGGGNIDWHAARSTLRLLGTEPEWFTFEITGPKIDDEAHAALCRRHLTDAMTFWQNFAGGGA
jgi:sugar phosphate isomerase/epimerase